MSEFLKAFTNENTRVPVWFMRQAGRYLPDYQKLRSQYSLNEMFRTPELACEVTVQPFAHLDLDAAILFADILTLPSGMGFDIDYVDGKGPVIGNPLTSDRQLEPYHDFKELEYVPQTIQFIKAKLSEAIPLIGFAGGPFTVLTYLIEGGSSLNMPKTTRLMVQHPQLLEQALELLTKNTIAYARMQMKAGIDAFQLFDTWGGMLRQADYQRWVKPYVERIFQAIDVPSLYYLKNAPHLLEDMVSCGSDGLSLCEKVSFTDERLKNSSQVLQGNLYNGLLFAAPDEIKTETLKVLTDARAQGKGYIFNLSHGVFPDTKVDTLKSIIEIVHDFKWK